MKDLQDLGDFESVHKNEKTKLQQKCQELNYENRILRDKYDKLTKEMGGMKLKAKPGEPQVKEEQKHDPVSKELRDLKIQLAQFKNQNNQVRQNNERLK